MNLKLCVVRHLLASWQLELGTTIGKLHPPSHELVWGCSHHNQQFHTLQCHQCLMRILLVHSGIDKT